MIDSKVIKAADYLREKNIEPQCFVVLGSGHGDLFGQLGLDTIDIEYEDIPNMPPITVAGHSGLASFDPKSEIIFFRGRKHFYEGVRPEDITFAHRLSYELGARKGIVTCSAGSVNPYFSVGDIVQVVDYIDMQNIMPLPSISREDISNFHAPDMAEIALKNGINLRRGILMALLGPTYETNAEVEMIRELGADLASMSTAPEIFAMRRMQGLEWMSFAVVTNVAAQMEEANHDEVLQEARKASLKLLRMIIDYCV
ncbi:MAG: purine-nucleoside phosphorylase [Candidatus Zixiibacteriota bacterium]